MRRRSACRGPAVVPWTVDAPEHAARARALGATAVITDDPARVRAALRPDLARRAG